MQVLQCCTTVAVAETLCAAATGAGGKIVYQKPHNSSNLSICCLGIPQNFLLQAISPPNNCASAMISIPTLLLLVLILRGCSSQGKDQAGWAAEHVSLSFPPQGADHYLILTTIIDRHFGRRGTSLLSLEFFFPAIVLVE